MTIAAIGVLLALPSFALGSDPPTQILVADNAFNPQSPAVRNFQSGPSFHWQRNALSDGQHNIRQDVKLFRSGDPTNGPIDFTRSASAGSFHYYCELHGSPSGGMAGVIKVRPVRDPNPAGRPFTVIWADSGTNTGKSFDVRFKVGTGEWQTWKNDTQTFRGVFGQDGKPVVVQLGRTYQFQVRSELAADHSKVSGWSPTLTVST